MAANPLVSQIVIDVNGTPTTYDIKDAYARQLISDLGDAVYWIGVTTTELVDDVTTSAVITVGGDSVTAKTGGMAQYNGEEFIYNGTKWQSVGKNNFGSLAFKNSASGSFTPQGSVAAPTISVTGDSTGTVNSITNVGTLPSFTVSGEVLTFNAGTLPTKGSDQTVVTNTGTISASAPAFTGTAGTVTVE